METEAADWVGRWDTKYREETKYFDASDNLFNNYIGNTDSQNSWQGFDLLAAYEHTFKDKKEHTLTVSEYFCIDPPTDVFNNENIIYPDGTTTDFNTHTISKAFENVLQADYNNKWGKHSLEAGVKHRLINVQKVAFVES